MLRTPLIIYLRQQLSEDYVVAIAHIVQLGQHDLCMMTPPNYDRKYEYTHKSHK